jgi:hypothetical protein
MISRVEITLAGIKRFVPEVNVRFWESLGWERVVEKAAELKTPQSNLQKEKTNAKIRKSS